MLLFALLLLLVSNRLLARSPIDTTSLWREILRIEAVFRDTTHLAFNATVYFTDSASVITHDTLQVAYKLSKQKYKIIMDSTEVIQNDFYHLTVYNEQDIAILSKPVGFGINLYHVKLVDSIFNRLYIRDLHATDSAGYRKLSFEFRNGSPYVQYDILYDTTNYRISRIEYKILKDPATPGATDHYKVRVICSGYQAGTFNDSEFSTNSYFTRKQGIYSLTATYNNYELINYLNQ